MTRTCSCSTSRSPGWTLSRCADGGTVAAHGSNRADVRGARDLNDGTGLKACHKSPSGQAARLCDKPDASDEFDRVSSSPVSWPCSPRLGPDRRLLCLLVGCGCSPRQWLWVRLELSLPRPLRQPR